MKIDEDLIFEQYEEIRNQLVRYINQTMTQKERDDHGQNLVEIVLPYRGLISALKIEQLERDDEYRKHRRSRTFEDFLQENGNLEDHLKKNGVSEEILSNLYPKS